MGALLARLSVLCVVILLLIALLRRWRLPYLVAPFKVFFVALCFVSAGLMIDLRYIADHWLSLAAITGTVLASNSLLSAVVFRGKGMSWRESWWAGALLSQTGELGLLACSLAAASGMIDEGIYKLAVAVTSLALLVSTGWTSVLRTILVRKKEGCCTRQKKRGAAPGGKALGNLTEILARKSVRKN